MSLRACIELFITDKMNDDDFNLSSFISTLHFIPSLVWSEKVGGGFKICCVKTWDEKGFLNMGFSFWLNLC